MKEKPSFVALAEFLLHDVARNLSLAPWRPHRLFNRDTTEPLSKRLARIAALHKRSQLQDDEYLGRILLDCVNNALKGHSIPDDIYGAFLGLAAQLIDQNELYFTYPIFPEEWIYLVNAFNKGLMEWQKTNRPLIPIRKRMERIPSPRSRLGKLTGSPSLRMP